MSLITLARSDFISLVNEILDYRDRVAQIPLRLGKLIISADPQETHFHIEHTSADTCTLWHIKDWRTHAEQMRLKKELSHHERLVSVHVTDLRDKLVRRLKAREEFMYLDDDIVLGMAERLVLGRQSEAVKWLTKLGMSDLIAADQQLEKFKHERGLNGKNVI